MKSIFKSVIKDILITCLFVFSATGIGIFFAEMQFQETNVVITYILSVLLVSRFTDGYLYGILATCMSLVLFNWFFTDPYFSLEVTNPTYTTTFIIMSVTAIITGALTSKAKKAEKQAKENEQVSNALYKTTNLLTDAEDTDAVASVTAKIFSEILNCDAAVICYDESGEPENSFVQQKGKNQIRRETHNKESLKRYIASIHTGYDTDSKHSYFPVRGHDNIFAAVRVPKEATADIPESKVRILYSVIESTALALERLFSIKSQIKTHEEAAQEHYRGNLLRAVSHDIRTPLSGIMGNAEMLMYMTEKDDPKYNIAAGIRDEANWLHSLVENILNLTKLHDGKVNLKKEPEAAEEVIGAAIRIMEKRNPDRTISVSVPDSLIMVPMDAKLISQVLVNLLDNADKHTPPDKEIKVSADIKDNNAEFIVSDRGSGISESDLPNIFQMFYTTRGKSPDSQRGIGLGLSICSSVVEAHGGKITANNREGGGAEFRFTLPLGGETK